jgi:hypothetical protein
METQLSPPRKTITKVLKALIERPEIKERDFRINSFRSILHELRTDYNLPIRFKEKKGVTEFGKPILFRVHYLWKSTLPKAVNLYNRINQAK